MPDDENRQHITRSQVMQKIYSRVVMVCLLGLAMPLTAQKFSFKPFAGYYYPNMADVNSKIDSDIRRFREILEAPIPFPATFNGNIIFGGQIEYHAGEDYLFSLNISYYGEKISTGYFSADGDPAWQFDYRREVRMIDVIFNMHYYLGYSSWKRFNKYIGIGAGVAFLNAKSFTGSTHPSTPIDTEGNFSGNILSGLISVGGNYRFSDVLKLWAEFGLQYGNFGQLDGTVTSIEVPQGSKETTESSFDLTGLYLRGGLGIALPF